MDIKDFSRHGCALIKRVQIVTVHCPLSYDVKAEKVVNNHYLCPLDQNK